MNKNIAIIVLGGLAAVGIIGAVYILVERPEASATFTSLLVQVLGLIIVAGGLGAGINKVTEEIKQVKTQTNGTLTALREENDRLTRENVELAKQVPTAEPTPQTRAEARERG